MEASNPNHEENSIERYRNLRLKESLCQSYLYPLACKELSFILRNAYSKFPKNLQSQIFQDTLFAFSLLPEMQIQSAISAANSLLQSSECALPKQKRALAVKGYKHAMVASKRKSKIHQEEDGLTLLPQDVLVQIFSFLDLQSLVSASAVCRLWNAAASDNHLWKFLHDKFFHTSGKFSKHDGICRHGLIDSKEDAHSLKDSVDGVGVDWRCAFKRAYRECSTKKFKSYRAYCLSCCSIVWLSNECFHSSNHQIEALLSVQQIVEYIVCGSLSSESSSDSDSDTDDASVFKLWDLRLS